MKKQRQSKADGKSGSGGALERWESISWDMLECWAGSRSVSRGRTYQRQGRVSKLGILPDGGIVATVVGGAKYILQARCTKTSGSGTRLNSTCSCPVGSQCKHAVAAVLELLDRLAENEDVPEVSLDDSRLCTLERSAELGDEDWSHEAICSEEIDQAIREHVQAKSHDELVEWILDLLQAHPEMFRELSERLLMETQDIEKLVASTRGMIADVTDEPGWVNHWNGDGELPDYAPLQKRLEHFLAIGRFDELVELGDELLEDGMSQVEMSHDEGETAMALGECMEVVFQGVARSSRSMPDKLLFAIEAGMKDGYGILDEATDAVFALDYSTADWSEVTDRLSRSLENIPRGESDGFSGKYQRDQLSGWLLRALDYAGRSDEIRAVYEREARETGSYERYVRYLMEHRCDDEAKIWAEEGIGKTRDRWPGIADHLIGFLKEIAHRQKNHKLAAAFEAHDFFSRPSLSALRSLLKSAGKARCKTVVHKCAREFLETGKLPWRCGSSKRGKTIKASDDWPLPIPAVLLPDIEKIKNADQPFYSVLLDIALDKKDSEAILHWYDLLAPKSRRPSFGRIHNSHYADLVAKAVRQSHPQRALDIYRQKIDCLLPHADQRNYAEIGTCLRKMKPICNGLNQMDDWLKFVEHLRGEYRRRPRFVEILDRLDNKTILQSRQKKK